LKLTNLIIKTKMIKNLIIISLYLLGISIHQLTGSNKTSASKSTEQPRDTIFSRLHTLSIHIKDPAIHDSVFHFLKDKLQLPVYYNPENLGKRKYAGIFAGNLVLEPCGPYTQFNYVTDFKAIFFGLNFETDNSISSITKVLENLNMKFESDGKEYIYIQDTDLTGENTFLGIANSYGKEKDHAKLDSLRSVMNSNIESDLGIEYVNEIQVGYPGNKNLERWKELIHPSDLDKGQVWHVSNGLNIRLMPDKIKEVKGITFKVKSLQNAKAYLKENDLLGKEQNDTIAIDPNKSFGLSICFTE